MEKKVIVRGNMFIVPNSAYNCIEEGGSELLVKSQNKRCDFLGLPFTLNGDEEQLIQVWMCDAESDNWQSHGKCIPGVEYPEDNDEQYLATLWPKYIKREMLANLREGDKLEISLENGVIVELTANQRSYRYKNFGNFEEVLEKVCMM